MKNKTLQIIAIFAFSFLVNFAWEHAHSVLYYLPSGKEISEIMLLRSTFFDALFVTILSLLFIKIDWLNKRIWLGILFSILCAIVVEKIALTNASWLYTNSMPIIPFLNVGLSPAFQLSITFYFVYKIFKLQKTA